jgi:WD40 repeat protein
MAVAFFPDGSLLPLGLDDWMVRLWNPSSGQEVQMLDRHTNWARAVVFHYELL